MSSAQRFSPIYVVPIEVARAIAPAQIRERLVNLEALGVDLKQTALLMTLGGHVMAHIDFVRPCPAGTLGLRFQTGVPLRENA